MTTSRQACHRSVWQWPVALPSLGSEAWPPANNFYRTAGKRRVSYLSLARRPETTQPARIIPNVILVLLAQRALDCIRRPLDVGRVGGRGRHNGNHHYWSALDTLGIQYRSLHPPAIRPEGRAARSILRERRPRHRAARSARQHRLARACRLVACVGPFDHCLSPCDHHHWDSLCLGALETCGAGVVADRKNDCARGHRAAALLGSSTRQVAALSADGSSECAN